MMVSTRGRYSLRLMVDIAKQGEAGTLISMRQAAERLDLSIKYLEQLGGALVRGGVLKSVRGVNGGYHLARPASQISIGEVLRATEGNCLMIPGLEDEVECARREGPEATAFWLGMSDALAKYMDGVSLADVVAFGKGK